MGVHNTVSAGVCECSMALKFEGTCGMLGALPGNPVV